MATSDAASHPRGPRRGRVLIVFGAKPGVGTSTVAVNLAIALHQLQESAILVEAHHDLGNLAALLNLQGDRHLDHALREGLDAALIAHHSGVRVLQRSPEQTAPSEEQMRELLDAARERAAFTLVDAAPRLDNRLRALVGLADRALMVTTPERTALRHAAWLLEQAKGWDVADKIGVVVNRWASESAVEVASLDAVLGDRVLGRLPSSGRLVVGAGESGRPFVLDAPDDPLSQAVLALARELRATLGST